MHTARTLVALCVALAAAVACGGPTVEALPPAERPVVDEDARVVAVGAFTPREHTGRGGVRVEEPADGARRMLFMDDFETDDGPALVVVLSPLPAAELTGENALADAVVVGDLVARRGAQAYALPAAMDVGGFRSVHVWCRSFDVLFAASDLTAP